MVASSDIPAPTPAQLLTAFGFSVFPVGTDKRPTVPSWEPYRDSPPTLDEVREWTGSDLAIACGPLSGVVVVDTDSPEAEAWADKNLPPTPWVVLTGIKNSANGFRGVHRYYRYPKGQQVTNRASIEVGALRKRVVDGRRVGTGLDIRGQGGYVVAPGSRHSSGVRYSVTNEWQPSDKALLPVYNPSWFESPVRPAPSPAPLSVRVDSTAYERAVKWLDKVEPPYEGERNNKCYSTACSLFDFGLTHGEVWGLISNWNRSSGNPLPEDELQVTVRSAERTRQAPQYPKGTLVSTGRASASPPPVTAPQQKPPQEWGEIKPLRSSTLPAFPLEVFAPWAREYLEALTRAKQTPSDFAGMFFLGALAISSQKRFHVHPNRGWAEPLPLWVLVACSSGSRKSQAFREVMRPLNGWEAYMREEFTRLRKEAKRRARALEAEIENGRRTKTPPPGLSEKEEELDSLIIPPLPRLYTGSATPEALEVKLGEHYGRYAFASAESDILATLMGKYRAGAQPPIEGLLSGWSGEDLKNDYRTREDADILEAHLSMVLATQPGNAVEMYGQEKLGGRGAFGRFLTVLPVTSDGDQWTEDFVPPDIATAYNDNLRRLLPSYDETVDLYLGNAPEPKDLHLQGDAQAAFRDFYNRTQARRKTGGDLQFLDEWSAKVCGQCARIAALLHLSDTPGRVVEKVSLSSVERAIYLVEQYLIPHAKAIFGSPVTDSTNKVWSVLHRLGPEISRQDLQQEVRPLSASSLTSILEALEEHGLLRVEKRPTGRPGRQPVFIVLRPDAPRSLSQGYAGIAGNAGNSKKPDFMGIPEPPDDCREFAGNSPAIQNTAQTAPEPSPISDDDFDPDDPYAGLEVLEW